MDLKGILSNKDKKVGEVYWALVVEPSWVQAGVWIIDKNEAKVIAISPPAAWESDEELITSADSVLSAAVSNLPEEAGEPTKTVFGVPNYWVTEGQIKKEYLEKIKVLCQKLSLTPVGFVVLTEGISHFMKTEEGSPFNGIVIGVGNENIEVSVIRLGNLQGSTQVARSVSVADDIAEGLARFSKQEAFPSRVVLYDGKEGELEDVRQSIMSANWEDYGKVKFLHTPKVEVIQPDKKVLATALAGGAELSGVSSVKNYLLGEEEEEKGEAEKEPQEAEQEKTVAEDVGFVVGKDVAKMEAKPKEERESQEEPKQEDLANVGKPKEDMDARMPGEKPSFNKNIMPSFFTNVKTRMSQAISKIMPGGKEPNLQGSKSPSRRLFIIGASFFVIILIALFALWWFLPKATVTVFVAPKRIEERVSIFIDPNADSVDSEEKTLPGKLVEESVSGEKTKSTTGTKTVGDKAKGEVTLFRSGSEVTLASGTELTGPNDLKFTLDEGVTVASGSAGTPGTAKANVTASDIGAQYNLASGETFDVGSYLSSDLEAKNESDFTGGSSREINAVSEEDQADLEEELKQELLDKAKEEITNSVEADEQFIEDTLESSVDDASFSNKVGDEATTLKLTMSLNAKALVVNKKDLAEFAKEILKDKVAGGYVLRDEQIAVNFEFQEEKDGIYELNTIIAANLLPEIKPDEIADKIVGKYPELAKDYLTNIQGFERAEIEVNPKLPGRLGTLPRLKKNITVEVAAEK
jgi:hypothetical protein